MNKEWFTALEIAGMPGMPATESGVLRKAKKDSWLDRARDGKGGGREYKFTEFPEETQKHLLGQDRAEQKSTGEQDAKKILLRERMGVEAESKARQEGILAAMALTGKAAARNAAKHTVISTFQTWSKSQNDQHHKASMVGKGLVQTFCGLYAVGQIDIDDETRAMIPSLDVSTLYRWMGKIKTGAHLGGKYGHRKGQGIIDKNQELKKSIVGMLIQYPHASVISIYNFVEAKFKTNEIPKKRALERWVKDWKTEQAELFIANANPDQWKNQFMAATGSLTIAIERLNQRWELDSSPADVMLKDGRHSLLAAIDLYSRRAKILVSKTSKAVSVGILVRQAMLDWGVPEELKCDNGQDYRSVYLMQVCNLLGIVQDFSAPFSPWEKAHIERFFRTFSHGIFELLPDFIGHNVAERKSIEARKAFSERLFKKNAVVDISLTAAELQKFCDEWTENFYHREEHGGLGTTPYLMAQAWNHPVKRIDNVRALDMLLAEAPGNNGLRIVQKKGIKIDGDWYDAPEMATYRGVEVQVRYSSDLGEVVIYAHDRPNDILDAHAAIPGYHFVCKAVCPSRQGFSREEVARVQADLAGEVKQTQKQKIQADKKKGKKIAIESGADKALEIIMEDRRMKAATVLSFPSKSTVYTSAGLAAAQAALDAEEKEGIHPEDPGTLEGRIAYVENFRDRKKDMTGERQMFASGLDRALWLWDEMMGGRKDQLSGEDLEFLKDFRRNYATSVRSMDSILDGKYEFRWDEYQTFRKAVGWPGTRLRS